MTIRKKGAGEGNMRKCVSVSVCACVCVSVAAPISEISQCLCPVRLESRVKQKMSFPYQNLRVVNERKKKGNQGERSRNKSSIEPAHAHMQSSMRNIKAAAGAFSPPRWFPGQCRHAVQRRRRSTASACLWSQRPLCDHGLADPGCPVLLRPMCLRPPTFQLRP